MVSLKKLIQRVLIQLVTCTLRSDNGGNFSSSNGGTLIPDNGGSRCLFKVTRSKLSKLIQAVLIQLVDHTLFSGNGGTLHSDNGGAGRLSKVTWSKL